jgi:predicted MFS family arabinose efflux permease
VPTVRDTSTAAVVENWRGVAMLGCAAFAIVTAEFLPIGLLPQIAASLGVSDGLAGLMVTMPGLLAAGAGPVLMALAGRIDRRIILAGLCLVLLASNLLAALAPGLATMLVARMLLGVVVGGFWTFAPGVSGRLVAPDGQVKAMAWLLSGISAATVAGVPAGVLAGGYLGWRGAFVLVATLGLLSAIALYHIVPPLPASAQRMLKGKEEASAILAPLRKRGSLAVLLVTLCAVTGQFAAYTYLAPVLREQFGLSSSTVTPMLFAYGVAGLASTLIVPQLIMNGTRAVLAGVFAMMVAALLLALHGGGTILATLCALAWGGAFGPLPGSLNALIQQTLPEDAEAGQAWFVGFFQTAIALGAWSGGIALDHTGTMGVLAFSGALVIAAASILLGAL